MFVSSLRKVFNRKKAPLREGRRDRQPTLRCRPWLECLEDRLAPAVVGTLSVSGNTLFYSGNSAANLITISQPAAGQLKIVDAAGTITVQASTGFSGNGTNTVTGTIPATVTSVIISGGGGTDLLTVGSPSINTTRTVTLSADIININNSLTTGGLTVTADPGGVINLAGVTVSTAAKPTAGAMNFTGPVIVSGAATLITDAVTDGNISFTSTITGAGGLSVNPGGLGTPNAGGNFTANGIINLGGSLSIGASGIAGANIVFLNQTNATGGVTLEANNTVTLNGGLTTTGPIDIAANQDGVGSEGFIQNLGDITTTSATGVSLVVNTGSGGTGSASIRDITTGPGGTVDINTGSATGGGAIKDNNGVGVLNINTGAAGLASLTAGNGGINVDTQTGNIHAQVTTTGTFTGDITIRNTLPGTLAVDGAFTSNGNITITNTGVTGVSGSIDLAGPGIVANGTNKTVTLTSTTFSITDTGGATITAPNVTLSAYESIGTALEPILLLPTTAVNLKASTTDPAASDGINVSSSGPMTVLLATANSGPINLTTGSGADLNINGNVSTGDGDITLTSGNNLLINSGVVSASAGVNLGDVTLAPTLDLTVSTGTTISADGDISVTATAGDTTDSLGGTAAAGGDIIFNGSTAGAFTLVSSGPLTAGGDVTATNASGGTDTSYTIGGSVTTGGDVALISGTGTFDLNLSGHVNAGGDVTVDDTLVTAGPVTMNFLGTITASGDFTILEDTGAGTNVAPTSIIMTGATTAGGDIAIGSLLAKGTLSYTLTSTGSLTAGGDVTITGHNAANTLFIAGAVTATFGDINITVAAATTTSSVSILGVMSATFGTTNVTSSSNAGVATNFIVTPSTLSTFTFSFDVAANTLNINTSFSNAGTWSQTFAQPITFTPASGLLPWTKLGGTVTVTPFNAP